MNKTIIDKLEAAGIKPEDIATRINVIAMLGDIQEALSVEIDEKLQRIGLTVASLDRLDIREIIFRAKRLRKPVDTLMSQSAQIGFGNTSDKLREVIFNHLTKKPKPARVRKCKEIEEPRVTKFHSEV